MKTTRKQRLAVILFDSLLWAILLAHVLAGLACTDETEGDDDSSDDDSVDDDTSTESCTSEDFCVYHADCMEVSYPEYTGVESLCLEDEYWRLEGEDARCPYIPYMTCLCACMELACSDYENLQDLCRSQCDENECEEQSAIPAKSTSVEMVTLS